MIKGISKFLTLCIASMFILFVGSCSFVENEFSTGVVFYVNNKVYDKVLTSGKDVIILPEDPNVDGYRFEYWYYINQDNEEVKFSSQSLLSIKINVDFKVYAKFTDGDLLYGIFYHTNEGKEIFPTYYDKNDHVKYLPNPERTGYTFKGWYKDKELTEAVYAPFDIEDNIDLYAKWEIKQYTINYNANDGVFVTEGTTKYTINDQIVLPVVEKEGYKFVGWILSGKVINSFEKGTAQDMVLVAKWEKEDK